MSNTPVSKTGSFHRISQKEQNPVVFHDRFMILDKSSLYHIGASIKDAGKKAFEISLIDDDKQTQEILSRL